jgi:hypothetical protein
LPIAEISVGNDYVSGLITSSRVRSAALGVCLFATVLGLNWATTAFFGSDMPDWDQWDAEGLCLFAPWFEHDHFVAHVFQPHNEHRVVLTKLQNFALVRLGGQWDQRVECLFNAFLHACIAVGVWSFGRRMVNGRWAAWLFTVIAALYGLPLAWQNLLGGFHSQQYWLIALSLVAIVSLPFSRTGSGRWWAGIAAATVVLGSMGSGFVAAAVVFGILSLLVLRRETTWRAALPTLLIMAVLIGVGLATRVEVSYHQSLKAKTIHDFVFSLLRSMEWPVRDHDWVSAVMWAPWAVLAVTTLRRGSTGIPAVPGVKSGDMRQRQCFELTVFALGGWVLVQLLATAYARGAGADYPASRYMDTLIFGAAVNAIALGWIVAKPPLVSASSSNDATGSSAHAMSRGPWRGGRTTAYAMALVWTTALIFGGFNLLATNLNDELPSTANYYRSAEGHLLAYLATNDPAELADPIPYPTAESLIVRLAHPSLRQLMPASVRPSLPIQPAIASNSDFVPNFVSHRHLNTAHRMGISPGTPALGSRLTWGSFNEHGPANTGEWRSTPVSSALHGWLKFETAGDLRQPGIQLELRDAATDEVVATVAPDKVPGTTWRSAFVHAPARPFVIVASDQTPNGWLAFSAPVEVSNLSYWALRIMKRGLLIAEVAGVLALLIGVGVFMERRTGTRSTARSSE